MRIYHLMVLVAAFAITSVLAPALMPLIRGPTFGSGPRERLANMTSLAMVCWTPVLTLIVLVRNRSRPRQIVRSYGHAAIIAAGSAVLLLLVWGLVAGLLGELWGFHAFPWFPHFFYCAPARQIVTNAPAAAASAVAAVWMVLAITGEGRKPSDSFDWIASLFGAFWLLWYIIGDDLIVLVPWIH